ncbi:hypothetical protein [Polyangium aurulentum]|uniref:hypothetical protein n=1 Tax=Polyangium aurulentum TaxID=2567896 RepID=UPI0010AEA00E|nr:hypothetical protein [Polyangium aurulentum]UQA60174.1 hypothetical protein E8A73_006760 [Polyangium aurulentum]
MTTRRPAKLRRSVDRDGVVKVELHEGRRGIWAPLLGLAAIVALAGLFFFFWGRRAASAPQDKARASAAPSARAAPRVVLVRPKAARPIAPPAEGSPPPPEDAQEEPAGAPEERSGIHVFPAPGTKRIKPGIVVPDEFELPPGYVRHYQATDKGEMLQAILMFHPDYELVDEAGNPIPVPADRVVPPEMAPPGLAVEMLEIPEDAYANPAAERAAALEAGVEPGEDEPEEDSADDAP